MRCSRNRDSRLPKMRNNRKLSLLGKIAHSFGLGKTAYPAHVGLNHADLSSIHQIKELVAGCQPLAGGNGDGLFLAQTCVAVQIVRRQWRFNEKQIEINPRTYSLQASIGIWKGI